MVCILPQEPIALEADIFQKLETEGATIEWIDPQDPDSTTDHRYYRIKGMTVVLRDRPIKISWIEPAHGRTHGDDRHCRINGFLCVITTPQESDGD